MKVESQLKSIAAHLMFVGPLTQKDAIKRFNCYRLASRIYDLRNGIGYPRCLNIRTTMVRYKDVSYAMYSLIKQQ